MTARCAEDGVLHIQCEKVKPGEAWPSALKGHQALDAVGQEESKKAMMLVTTLVLMMITLPPLAWSG